MEYGILKMENDWLVMENLEAESRIRLTQFIVNSKI